MALKIRLQLRGRTNRPFYRLVLIDSRSPRGGRSKEILGWYNPFETDEEKQLNVKADRVDHWLNSGAVMSDKAEAIVMRVSPEVVKKHRQQAATKRMNSIAQRRTRKSKKKAA